MKNFDQFINEKFEYGSSYINNKKITSSFQGSTSNMNEFIKHIKDLPKTLESIKIPVETSAFNPKNEKFKGPITSSDKSKIIKIIKEITKEFKDKGDSVYEYSIRSFYGVLSKEREVTNPVYITFKTKAHDKFGKDMSSGRYGSLD